MKTLSNFLNNNINNQKLIKRILLSLLLLSLHLCFSSFSLCAITKSLLKIEFSEMWHTFIDVLEWVFFNGL